jgi:2-polyprenyl-3-methyl-5-hydroxy-6-metoxy-1,4-benzoquinol methylase
LKPSYIGLRADVLSLVPSGCKRFLDLGCATGATGAAIKAAYPGVRVVGVERDAQMAVLAQAKLDRVVVADLDEIETVVCELAGECFDCIICGDVLEHLIDPWLVLRSATRLCSDRGHVLASLPNVAHISTFMSLLRHRWPYRDRGIHDSSHLRFFARSNVLTLFAQAGLNVTELRRNYRVIERPHRWNRFARYFAVPGMRDFLTFQFLVVATPLAAPAPPRLAGSQLMP